MDFKFIKYYAVLFLLLAFSSAVRAYTVQFADENKNIRLRWKKGVIPIAVSNSLTKQIPSLKSEAVVLAAVQKSLSNWERIANVKFAVAITDKQSVSANSRAGDGINLITIAPMPENLLLFNGGSEEISARTQTLFNGKGFITEADIVLNPYQQFSVDGAIGTFDLEATLTHEIGHLLGLEHSLVPSATMFEHQGKNGTYGLANFAPRSLAVDDVTGIRSLYGAKNSGAECCGTISGKILSAVGKPAKDSQIWVEEAETGRVAAGVLTGANGSFRFEGLAAGRYSLYAQNFGESKNAAGGQFLGETEVIKGKSVSFSKKLKSLAKTFEVSHIGFNGQLSELAIPVNGGKTFLIYVGGKNLDAEKLTIGFNSPNLGVVPGSLTKQDFGAEISVVGFEVRINPRILPGEYSFFLRGENDETAYVIGGLTIDDFVNPWSAAALFETDGT